MLNRAHDIFEMRIVVNGVTNALAYANTVAKQNGRIYYAFRAGDLPLLICPEPISESTATWMMQNGHNIYTPLSIDAQRIATTSGAGAAIFHSARKIGYFDCWKRVNNAGNPAGQSHAFFGNPL